MNLLAVSHSRIKVMVGGKEFPIRTDSEQC